jgi:hypothetical protein
MSTSNRSAAAKKAAATRARKAAAAKAATPPPGVQPPERTPDELDAITDERARIAALDAAKTRIESAEEALADLERSVTQREWIIVMGKLAATREQINRDGSLRLLALAWVNEKREHGGASWDRLLDMTDEELLEAHGFSIEDASLVAEAEAKAEAEGGNG